MRKRRAAYDPRQGVLSFEPPREITRESQLEGLDRRVSSAVGYILTEAARAGHSRFQVAAGVSELLNDDVTKAVLDAYASEGKDSHNISFARFLALVAETGAYSVLNGLLIEIGATVLVGEEIAAVELGHVQAQLRDLKQRESQLMKVVQPIRRGGK